MPILWLKQEFSCFKGSILSASTKILTLKLVERTLFAKVKVLHSKALIFKEFDTFRSDPDPSFFGSCSAPEPDPDPNGNENQDPDPNQVVPDPQN